MQQTLISPARYAKLRNLSRSTISRQIASGLIPLREGKIDPREADQARARHLNPVMVEGAKHRKSARPASRRGRQCDTETESTPSSAEDALSGAEDRGRRAVVDAILAKAPDLTGVLVNMGAPAAWALAAPDLALSLIWAALDVDDEMERLYPPDGPSGITASDEELAASAGLPVPLDAALSGEIDGLAEKFCTLVTATKS